MRISDWSSDVCSSDLQAAVRSAVESMSSVRAGEGELARQVILGATGGAVLLALLIAIVLGRGLTGPIRQMAGSMRRLADGDLEVEVPGLARKDEIADIAKARSEEHTSELQSLMRISYAVFCLKKKTHNETSHITSDR